MGKFDGWLICSDFDGTFAVAREIVPENLEAVRYFTDNGGRFTVATGRTVGFIRERMLDRLINAPACLANGSAVYDYATDSLLREKRVPVSTGDFLEAVSGIGNEVASIFLVPDMEQGSMEYASVAQVPKEYWNVHQQKILCKFETVEAADIFKAQVLAHPVLSACYISKSWRFGVEFNAADGTKGHALDFIKAYLGDVKTAVGVGDYENDLTLLQHADIGAVPESGMEQLKQAADWILVSAKEAAIRDLILKIEQSL